MTSKILVVEDEPFQLITAVHVVEDAGFEALEAHDADEALRLLESVPDIKVLWTDIDMPGSMDGLRLAAVVRNRWASIGILVVSGMKRPEDDQLPERSVFYPKPYDIQSVLDTLIRLAT
ncbi:two-component system response regulator [Rhizobium leguminosarum]|uniref:Two-component system response regulator n=1 Tax=Rhizobium leguminosarum TaxID=384 RepID=A0A4Q1UFQ6_RHILE|nr:response regulator [Rhizobium leguminosarum]RXT29895.1 two-component system response regulator [Rhizobium leguminosarum]